MGHVCPIQKHHSPNIFNVSSALISILKFNYVVRRYQVFNKCVICFSAYVGVTTGVMGRGQSPMELG